MGSVADVDAGAVAAAEVVTATGVTMHRETIAMATFATPTTTPPARAGSPTRLKRNPPSAPAASANVAAASASVAAASASAADVSLTAAVADREVGAAAVGAGDKTTDRVATSRSSVSSACLLTSNSRYPARRTIYQTRQTPRSRTKWTSPARCCATC